MHTPCLNHEVKKAFIFSLYTGLRWVDVKSLSWSMIKNKSVSVIQNKTKIPLKIPLHSIAKSTLGKRKEGLVFQLPNQDGANKILGKWCMNANSINTLPGIVHVIVFRYYFSKKALLTFAWSTGVLITLAKTFQDEQIQQFKKRHHQKSSKLMTSSKMESEKSDDG